MLLLLQGHTVIGGILFQRSKKHHWRYRGSFAWLLSPRLRVPIPTVVLRFCGKTLIHIFCSPTRSKWTPGSCWSNDNCTTLGKNGIAFLCKLCFSLGKFFRKLCSTCTRHCLFNIFLSTHRYAITRANQGYRKAIGPHTSIIEKAPQYLHYSLCIPFFPCLPHVVRQRQDLTLTRPHVT